MARKARPKNADRQPTFIKAWRKHRHLTLAQLAERLLLLKEIAISEGQLSRIERGEQPYSQDLLEAIADALTTDPASLLMRDPTQGDAIWSIWETLDQPERAQFTRIAQAFKKAG